MIRYCSVFHQHTRVHALHDPKRLVRWVSTNPHAEYMKTLLKKLIFQVHPDYFHNFKNIQEINSANLSVLNNIIDDFINNSHRTKIDVRTLTFYLKPSEEKGTPKKVKISLQQLADSISEVLDTIGVDVPEKPANFQSSSSNNQFAARHYGFYQNIIFQDDEAKITRDFLDSLCERREIIALREEREILLREAEKKLLEMTGLEKIEYWNSWSAHNNALLLSRIIEYLTKKSSEITSYPWHGMRLIIARDDCSHNPIDYVERCIRIDCGDVPSEWMYTFTQITSNQLRIMADVQAQIRVLEANFLAIFRHYWQLYLDRYLSTLPVEERGGIRRYTVQMKKGFTCSEHLYGHFLLNMNAFKSIITTQSHTPTATLDTNLASDTSSDSSSDTSTAVDATPLVIEIILEDAHGTKVLQPSGQLRIDAKATASDLLSLLDSSTALAYQSAVQYQSLRDQCDRYHREIVSVLGISVLGRIPGIDEEKYLHALQGIHGYLERKNGSLSRLLTSGGGDSVVNRGIFRNVQGMKLMIGYYCGLRDDGACILPWNIPVDKL